MRPDRFQYLYAVIGDTLRYEAEEEQILAAVQIPDFGFESLVDLSYRDALGLAMVVNYLAYRDLLMMGGSDVDGFVYQEAHDARAITRMLTFLDERATYVQDQITQHELIEARKHQLSVDL